MCYLWVKWKHSDPAKTFAFCPSGWQPCCNRLYKAVSRAAEAEHAASQVWICITISHWLHVCADPMLHDEAYIFSRITRCCERYLQRPVTYRLPCKSSNILLVKHNAKNCILFAISTLITVAPCSAQLGLLTNTIMQCSYYGHLSQRFCNINRTYQELFEQCFNKQYGLIHRLETNKLRNVARLFAVSASAHHITTESMLHDCAATSIQLGFCVLASVCLPS